MPQPTGSFANIPEDLAASSSSYSTRFQVCCEWDQVGRQLVKRPQEAMTTQYLIDSRWKAEGFNERPEICKCVEEHYYLCRWLKHKELAVAWLSEEWVVSMCSIFTRDNVLMTPAGGIRMVLHQTSRIGEPEEVMGYLEQLGVKTLHEIEDPAKMSGQDAVWLGPTQLVVALTERTNQEAVDQLKSVFSNNDHLNDVKIIVVDLSATNQRLADENKAHAEANPVSEEMADRMVPVKWRVKDGLVSCLCPVSDKKLIICPERFPHEFIERLEELGFELFRITMEEWNSFGAETYVHGPKRAVVPLMEDGGLERIIDFLTVDMGMYVTEHPMSELLKSGRGPRSMVLPFIRSLAKAQK